MTRPPLCLHTSHTHTHTYTYTEVKELVLTCSHTHNTHTHTEVKELLLTDPGVLDVVEGQRLVQSMKEQLATSIVTQMEEKHTEAAKRLAMRHAQVGWYKHTHTHTHTQKTSTK